jgi:hypothetical protein
MSWNPLLAGVSAALASILATLVVRNLKEKRGAYAVVFVIAFVILNFLSRSYVLPAIRVWEAPSQAQKLIEGNRLFSLLAVKHPEIREQYTRLVVDLARKGATTEETYVASGAWGRQLVKPYLGQYVPYASDEALVNFFSFFVSILEQLKGRQDDACFVWMFGDNVANPMLLPNTMREADQQGRMLDVMADVVESAITEPHQAIDQQQAAQELETFINVLAEKHGRKFLEALAMLEQPHAPSVDRKAVCDAATTLYREALLLPEGGRELLLRSLFVSKAE